MPYYDGLDIYEGVNVNKARASEECHICHYWYFLNCNYFLKNGFQPNA